MKRSYFLFPKQIIETYSYIQPKNCERYRNYKNHILFFIRQIKTQEYKS